MGIRINTNIPALTAMRHMSVVEGQMQGLVTRLSTGLRINSASDDPAGLVISEGLRTQIKGIEQALRNVQDAVNMSKTAESALEEVSKLLRDMRSLAVHSSNSATVDASQLAANQQQAKNIIESVDRIAKQTAWGSKKLLNGASGVQAALTRTDLASSLYIGPEVGSEPVATGSVQATRVTQATQAQISPMATVLTSGTDVVGPGTFILNGRAFTVQTGQTAQDVIQMLNQAASETGVTAQLVPNGAGVSLELTATKYGSIGEVQYLETNDIFNSGNGATAPPATDAVFSVTIPTSSGTITETYTAGAISGSDGLTLLAPSGNRLTITASGNATAGTVTIGQVTVGSMRFQTGPNSDQSALFSIPSIFANTLGTSVIAGKSLADIDLTTPQGALDAMKIIDEAVSQTAVLRGNLGSFQKNFLESNARSLEVAQENLTASESMIRDADIAKEMSEYTKVQILRQSGIAVLAQANQAPQQILRLIGQ